MLAPEGRPLILSVVLAGGVLLWLGFVPALLLWLLALALGHLLWETKREVPSLPLGLVSPVDGRVRLADTVWDPWLKREAICIGIRLPPLGFAPLRSPTEGKVMEYRQANDVYHGDSYTVAPTGKTVCRALWVRTDEGDDVVFIITSQSRFHRLLSDIQIGQRIGQGQRCGYIFFGSRVDVLAPDNSRVETRKGEKILGGEGVVATLIHS